MASDIETLIRQALARQNAFDPEVRAKIYQSSRNALARIIVKSGAVEPSIIEKRSHALEETIARIEAEFVAAPEPQINTVNEPTTASMGNALAENTPGENVPEVDVAPPMPEPQYQPDTTIAAEQQFDEFLDQNQNSPSVQTTLEPNFGDRGANNYNPNAGEDLQDYAAPTPYYTQARQRSWRPMNWVVGIALLAILGWIGYVVFSDYFLPRLSGGGKQGQISSKINPIAAGTISILEPTEPDALVTAGRGTASIIDTGVEPAIRITSVREQSAREKSADPILLEIAPGILKNIAGKKIRVEIRAKSGGTGPATFAIACQFGALGECGRKRFRVGLQPETIIFTIAISDKYTESQQAFLAINTDVTSAAKLNGVGAAVDFIYARLTPNDGN